MGVLAGSVLAGRVRISGGAGQTADLPIADGPFKATEESLSTYKVPDWYRDAKFGIWAHWGPQSAAEDGDWYARNMYIQGNKQYEDHLKKYGHPSKFGFKDVIATFKADQFDPERLMDLYVKAGAKYFCSMGVHHDNFDMWDSTYQPRWNAAKAGPKKDIVAMWRDAAKKRGLRFAVSEHLSNSYNWFSTSHQSDKTGPMAGVPYDGTNPDFADLYHALPKDYVYNARDAMSRNAPDSWKQLYFKRIKELTDKYQPDLLYTDGGIPFGEYGLALVANHYNQSAKRNNGVADAIYTSKAAREAQAGMCILDLERGVAGGIPAQPWQTDTCIGEWHYHRGAKYKAPKRVIDMLVDIVSRNGNLMLNFPLPNSGMLDSDELNILDQITKWMNVNSEGIYATRPWKIFGEGPVANAPTTGRRGGGGFNEGSRKDFTADEIRFTTKGPVLYAFVMGWPQKAAVIKSLATGAPNVAGKIAKVELLGGGDVTWTQHDKGLIVQMPGKQPSEHAITLKITGVL
jgi:alpha-L-fucosidase